MKKTVAGILTKKEDGVDKILLTKRAVDPYKDYWCLPGGHIESGESTEEALLREVEEETGLVFIGNFFGEFRENIPEKDINNIVSVYEGYGIGKEKLNDEVSEIRWLAVDKIFQLNLAFRHKEILVTFLANNDRKEINDNRLREYEQLRNEVVKHIDIRVRILQLTLILFSAFIGFISCACENQNVDILLFYPIVATFFAALWSHSDLRIYEISEFIKTKVEPYTPGINWENYIRGLKSGKSRFKKLLEFSAGGFFFVSQILAIFFYLYFYHKSIIDRIEIMIILALDIASIVYSIYLVSLRRKYYKKEEKSKKN